MRRVFPVAAVIVAVTVALTAFLLRSETPPAAAAGDVALRSSTDSQPVLLSPSEDPPPAAATPAATPAAKPVASPEPTPTSSASPLPRPKKPKKPKAATRTSKARNIPERPLDKHTGKRIVYDKALMTVWLMDKRNQVVGRYPVVGRWDRPAKGTYRVFSKSDRSGNPNSKVTFNHMVRFTYGPDTKSPIGFHSIPRYYDGSRMHPVSSLGLPIATGGCIRMADKDAKAVYDFMNVGDLVVVLPSP